MESGKMVAQNGGRGYEGKRWKKLGSLRLLFFLRFLVSHTQTKQEAVDTSCKGGHVGWGEHQERSGEGGRGEGGEEEHMKPGREVEGGEEDCRVKQEGEVGGRRERGRRERREAHMCGRPLACSCTFG